MPLIFDRNDFRPKNIGVAAATKMETAVKERRSAKLLARKFLPLVVVSVVSGKKLEKLRAPQREIQLRFGNFFLT